MNALGLIHNQIKYLILKKNIGVQKKNSPTQLTSGRYPHNTMELAVILAVTIELIAYIHCMDIKGYDFTILPNKRGISEVISILVVTSVIQWAILCSSTEGCNQANFRNSTKCEILMGSLGEDMDKVDEPNTMFICMYIPFVYLYHFCFF